MPYIASFNNPFRKHLYGIEKKHPEWSFEKCLEVAKMSWAKKKKTKNLKRTKK